MAILVSLAKSQDPKTFLGKMQSTEMKLCHRDEIMSSQA